MPPEKPSTSFAKVTDDSTKSFPCQPDNLMSDSALVAISHFVGSPALWNAFVAKITGIRVLGLIKFAKDFLFLMGCFLYPFIEFITRCMRYFGLSNLLAGCSPGCIEDLFFSWFPGIGCCRLTVSQRGQESEDQKTIGMKDPHSEVLTT